MRKAITKVALLDTPAMQCTKTFVLGNSYSSSVPALSKYCEMSKLSLSIAGR